MEAVSMTIPAEQPVAEPMEMISTPESTQTASPAVGVTTIAAVAAESATIKPETVSIEVGSDELVTLIDLKQALLEETQAKVAEAKAAMERVEAEVALHFAGVTALRKARATLTGGSTLTLTYHAP